MRGMRAGVERDEGATQSGQRMNWHETELGYWWEETKITDSKTMCVSCLMWWRSHVWGTHRIRYKFRLGQEIQGSERTSVPGRATPYGQTCCVLYRVPSGMNGSTSSPFTLWPCSSSHQRQIMLPYSWRFGRVTCSAWWNISQCDGQGLQKHLGLPGWCNSLGWSIIP